MDVRVGSSMTGLWKELTKGREWHPADSALTRLLRAETEMACYYVMLSGSLFQASYLWQPQDKGVGRDSGGRQCVDASNKEPGSGGPGLSASAPPLVVLLRFKVFHLPYPLFPNFLDKEVRADTL